MTKYAIKLTGLVALALALSACGQGGPPEFPPPQVNVAQVVQKQVQLWDEFSGRVEAVDTVELRPRVSGYLSEVHFDEGSSVSKGQLLFSIDDREYQAAVDSAKANLARAESRVALAQTEVERSERLIAQRATSQGELDQRRGELQQAQADVNTAKASLATAELNLSFTKIVSPIDGQIGEAMIKPGNLVSPSTTLLSTVVSVDPIYVTFEADEQVFLKYKALEARKLAEERELEESTEEQELEVGEEEVSESQGNRVEIGLANESGFSYSGELVFIDNKLNPNTGTILAKAELSNSDGLFTPGLYARVRLQGSDDLNVLLINETAIANDLDRKYVYVVGENNLAQRKDVELGAYSDGLRVVNSGLSANDLVVINGTSKIFFSGMPVEPITVPMDQPEQAPQQAAQAQ